MWWWWCLWGVVHLGLRVCRGGGDFFFKSSRIPDSCVKALSVFGAFGFSSVFGLTTCDLTLILPYVRGYSFI